MRTHKYLYAIIDNDAFYLEGDNLELRNSMDKESVTLVLDHGATCDSPKIVAVFPPSAIVVLSSNAKEICASINFKGFAEYRKVK